MLLFISLIFFIVSDDDGLVSFSFYFFLISGLLAVCYVGQAGLKLNRDPSTSASLVLGLKACATTHWWRW